MLKTSKLSRLFSFTFVLALLVLTTGVFAQAKTGQPAPDFTLSDQDGKPVKLSDYKGKIVVLEWINPECPFVKGHYETDKKTMTKTTTEQRPVYPIHPGTILADEL